MVDGLITGAINFALFGSIVWLRRLVNHEGLPAFGLRGDRRSWRLLVAGAAAGTVLFSAYSLIAVLLGSGVLSVARGHVAQTLALLVCWAFGFGGVALFEEGLFRGYLFPKMRLRLPLAGAIASQATLFAVFHMFSFAPGRYLWLGLLNTIVLGIAMALLVVRTRSLMPAVGLHAAWDLVQTVLLWHQVHGTVTTVNLEVAEGLWTGTQRTPEMGLINTIVLAGLAVLLVAGSRGTSPSSDMQ